jgi:large subunit ribosomal protein L5
MQRLKKFYLNDVVPLLTKRFNYTNMHQVPRVQKIIINRGFGEMYQNSKVLNLSIEELTKISGQRPVVIRATQAISGFKVREGMFIGLSVTLRCDKMYAFLDRLINLTFPRIRDFQGCSLGNFDGSGNFSLGLTEQLMFPEISFEEVTQLQGMNITIVTNCKTDAEGIFLLKSLGVPFRDISGFIMK